MLSNNDYTVSITENQDTVNTVETIRANLKKQTSKKTDSLKLSNSFHRLGYHKKANRVYWCATDWIYKIYSDGEILLHDVNFCRERLCPMCAARRSLKVFKQVSDVMDIVDCTYNDLVPVFLTLTLKNCHANSIDLSKTLDLIYDGWFRMTHHRKIQRVVKGWFRALEVTFNTENSTFHPHIHAILLVDKEYFTGKDFMFTSDWVKLWRSSLRIDYDPVCDIRKISNERYHSVSEVSKYTVKSSDYIFEDEYFMDLIVENLGQALKSRRLYAFGGVMKSIAKEIGLDDKDIAEGDLVNIENFEVREDISYVLKVFRWNMGLSEYVEIDEKNVYTEQN